MRVQSSAFCLVALLLWCWLATFTASAQIQLDRPKQPQPLPNPYTLGLTRQEILETAREVLKSCQIPFVEKSRRIVPLEDKLVTGYLLFADGVTARTDLAHYAKLPAAEVRVWTGGRVRLEIRALPLDEKRSQLQIAAFIQGRVAPVGAYSRDETWVDCESNGRLEDQVLRGLAGKLLGLDLSIDQEGQRRILQCEY